MEITSFGLSSLRIKGKNTTIVTDPYDSDVVGLKFPKHITADVVTVSHDHPDHNLVSHIEGAPFVISGPGEYEIKGVGIVGISSYHDEEKGEKRGKNTMYRIDIDGVSIVHLGDLGHPLSVSDIDALGNVDILCIPVGGEYTITSEQACEIIKEIEPSIVIPIHYGRPELSQKTFGSLTPLSHFLKLMGKESVVPQAKLVAVKDKMPDGMDVVPLE